ESCASAASRPTSSTFVPTVTCANCRRQAYTGSRFPGPKCRGFQDAGGGRRQHCRAEYGHADWLVTRHGGGTMKALRLALLVAVLGALASGIALHAAAG